MDPNISRDAGVREERPVKSYGHTTIGNGARAHLGDVSQDLNILGGVHIHMHDHLWNVVSVTDEMIQLLHFYTNVLRLGLRLRHDNKYVQWSDVVNLRDFLLNLPSMQARLRIAQVWVQNSANSLIVGEVGSIGIFSQSGVSLVPSMLTKPGFARLDCFLRQGCARSSRCAMSA